MQKVRLVGNIAKFGEVWETNCSNIRDIFRLIECQTTGFRKYLVEAAEANVDFAIQRGDEFLETPEELLLSLNDEDIIITEVPAGSKSGFGKILAAIALVVISFYVPGAASFSQVLAGASLGGLQSMVLLVAANLALTGITQLMAPGPETDKKENEGYLFNGPDNNIQQGVPIPVVYGELKVGGAPISVSFKPASGGTTGSHGRSTYAITVPGAEFIPPNWSGWTNSQWAVPNAAAATTDLFSVRS